MEIIDLRRELFHRAPVHPSHPPIVMPIWDDHHMKVTAGNTTVSSKALSILFSDHAGTHVDAPAPFDPRPGAPSIDQFPLENFYTSANCLDLSHVPLKDAMTVKEMEAALTKSGEEIKPRDTMLIYMATLDIRAIFRALRLNPYIGLPTRASACSAWKLLDRRPKAD